MAGTGADALVGALEQAGVEAVFGLPGVHVLPVWAALRESPIRLVGTRHEQAAAYAADGLARTTGRPGVAIVTTGPGAANTVCAVGEAAASGSPLVVIATDVATGIRRPGVHRGALHETAGQAAMFSPFVKAALRAERASEVGPAVAAALGAAAAPPAGPVCVEIPTDLLGAQADPAPPPARPAVAAPPDPAAIAAAAALLGAARQPLIWAGGGAVRAGAGPALAALAQRLGAPVLETYGARGIIPPGHPSWVGLPPHVPEAGRLWDEADAVLVAGSDLDGMSTQNWRMPQPPRLAVIDVDPVRATRDYPADAAVAADAAAGAAALGAALAGPAQAPWADLEAGRTAARARLAAEAPGAWELLGTLSAVVGPDTPVFADMAIPGYWTAGFHPFARPRRLAYPVGWGTLGFAFPASLGAAAAGEGPVLCVCGDGGFLFACGELATAAQEELDVCVLVVDDGGYGMLRYDQARAGSPAFGVDLAAPDWTGLAAAFGVPAETAPDLGEGLAAALRRGLAGGGPRLVSVQAQLPPPPTTSPRWYRAAAAG